MRRRNKRSNVDLRNSIPVDGEVANSEQISTSASVAPTSSPSSTIPDETTTSSSVSSSSSPPYSASFTETITSATGLVTGNMASAIYTYSPSGHAPNFEPACVPYPRARLALLMYSLARRSRVHSVVLLGHSLLQHLQCWWPSG